MPYYRNISFNSPEALRRTLYQTIRDHKVLSYRDAWKVLKDSDRDPESKNQIILVYTEKSLPYEYNSGRNNRHKDYWNREHIWPKSHGFKNKKSVPFKDVHNLKPADRTVNSSRGNKDFDFSETPHKEAENARIDHDSFEPPPSVKGDIARILFYMDLRYEGENGEPDLMLVDRVGTSGVQLGKLCTLYLWHLTDPVSEFEQRRNERIYFWQKNRNPFIDHPEWAEILWGKKCGHAL
ncbi:MAG: endonuclease [Spirochaetia bacterium]|nr:endonuclease [Spirochaetia bacterium]